LRLYAPDPKVVPHIQTYYDIVIWGAPLVLTGMVNLGWLIGRRQVREALILQISSKRPEYHLDIIFVLWFKMEVTGVALATLIAQAYGFTLGFFIISRKLELLRVRQLWRELISRASMIRIMKVNSDLMIRTVCLLIMTNMFFAKGSELGVDLLAVNAVLFQVQYIIAYLFDGVADAARIYAGKCYQEKNPAEFDRIYQVVALHTMVLSVILSCGMLLLGDYIIPVFTDLEQIITLSNQYLPWLVVFPFTIGFGLTYYGIYTGVTYTSTVRNSHTVAVIVFIASYYTLIPIWGNHGLWLAFILFSLTRSLYLILHKNRLKLALFGEHPGG
jgi:MATE family multidrug resistance protein